MKLTNQTLLKCPVSEQDFMWLATYNNDTFLSEYSLDNQQQNSFYDINKEKLIRFGLVGMGMQMYFEVYGGAFNIAGHRIEIIYRDKETGKEHYLTDQPLVVYNSIIQYKNAEMDFNPAHNSGTSESTITQFNFGYQQLLNIDDVNFNFKVICGVPYGKNIYLNIRLVSDKNMDGEIIIKKDGNQQFVLDAPLTEKLGGEVNWEVT